jgi:hypothetical protein
MFYNRSLSLSVFYSDYNFLRDNLPFNLQKNEHYFMLFGPLRIFDL